MKKSKFSDTQIVSILKGAEAGIPVKEVCRQHQISSACYYMSVFKQMGQMFGLAKGVFCASFSCYAACR